jgi:hypothetical protein
MTVFADISAGLDRRLNTMTGKPPIAWENKKFAPTQGTLYARPTIIPADTEQWSLGQNGQDLSTGIYQVDVIAPAGKGKKAAYAMADTIADRFKRGTDIVENSRTISIINASRAAGFNDGDRFIVPVTIQYRAFTAAR